MTVSPQAANADDSVQLQPQPNGPMPTPTPVSEPYWTGGLQGVLRYQWCAACSLALMDPQPACTRCLRQELEWRDSSGTGHIVSYTVVWRPPLPQLEVPYAPAIVALDEGFELLTNIVGCSVGELAVGLAVQVAFGEPVDGVALPYFTPR